MSEDMTPLPMPKPRSDLGIRTLSGVVMMSIAIAAIWFGGIAFVILIIAVGLGVFWEFARLVVKFASTATARLLWLVGGWVYIALACFALLVLSAPFFGMTSAILLIAGVIGTDVGAYFAGRTFGGPKIAPRISPSKTWSGLIGGMIGAGALMIIAQSVIYWGSSGTHKGGFAWGWLASTGIAVAAIAQAGDFFESWMKRKAGVKDSGRLLPGHGGLFDRTDGLIAVSFVAGLMIFVQIMALD